MIRFWVVDFAVYPARVLTAEFGPDEGNEADELIDLVSAGLDPVWGVLMPGEAAPSSVEAARRVARKVEPAPVCVDLIAMQDVPF